MLQNLNIESEAKTLVNALPLGWKQKLSFSVAMVHEPKIVFLDEPNRWRWSHHAQGILDAWFIRAAERGTTVFVTTHYMDEAEYCGRVSIMVDGRIDALGTPTELKTQFNAKDMDEVFYD